MSRQIESAKLEIRWDLSENRQTDSHHKASGYYIEKIEKIEKT